MIPQNTKFRNIQIATLIISIVLSLVGDLIYGTKTNAEEYLFGNFIIDVSSLLFAIFSIITLFGLIYLLIGKLQPIILEKIKFEEDINDTTKY